MNVFRYCRIIHVWLFCIHTFLIQISSYLYNCTIRIKAKIPNWIISHMNIIRENHNIGLYAVRLWMYKFLNETELHMFQKLESSHAYREIVPFIYVLITSLCHYNDNAHPQYHALDYIEVERIHQSCIALANMQLHHADDVPTTATQKMRQRGQQMVIQWWSITRR